LFGQRRSVAITAPVYKIARPEEWAEAETAGVFGGSPDDKRDGFLHLSAPDQVRDTVRKHFAGERSLLLVAVDSAVLGFGLKWEVSRGGARFPHLYGPRPLSAVISVAPLRRGEDGVFEFPPAIP
jgi:uncharacterized protein (DUF952 family)